MGAKKSETSVIKNVVSSLASQLQDLSYSFKKDQSKYLKRKFFVSTVEYSVSAKLILQTTH